MNQVEVTDNFIRCCERERHALGLTQSAMAKALDMSLDSYKKMVSGARAKVDLYTAIQLHMLTGKSIRELCGDTSPEPRLVSRINLLSDRQRRFIADIVEFELAMRAGHHDHPDTIPCLVPTGNVQDGMIWDSCAWGRVEVGDYVRRFPEVSCGIRITSNHLHPAYVKDDVLLIARKPPRDGDVAVIVNHRTGAAYIRTYRQGNPCRMVPVNGYGDTFTVDPNDPEDMAQWHKFGIVITKLR